MTTTLMDFRLDFTWFCLSVFFFNFNLCVLIDDPVFYQFRIIFIHFYLILNLNHFFIIPFVIKLKTCIFIHKYTRGRKRDWEDISQCAVQWLEQKEVPLVLSDSIFCVSVLCRCYASFMTLCMFWVTKNHFC